MRIAVNDLKPAKITGDETEVTVRPEIKQPETKSVSTDYAMGKSDSTWKAYDTTVSGISLVPSFRDQSGEEVRGRGIDGLIKTLHVKNVTQASIWSGNKLPSGKPHSPSFMGE